MEKVKNNVAAERAAGAAPPGPATEQGGCYERLDVEKVEIVEVGQEMLQALKVGDRILIAFDPSEDPCFTKTKQVDGALYADGYVPLYSLHCHCSMFDVFAIVRLPLYVRGPLPTRRHVPPPSVNDLVDYLARWYYYLKNETVVVARYDGNKFDIVDDNDYDYFLAMLTYYDYTFNIKSVEGAVWYGVYSWWDDYVYDENRGERIAEFTCCKEGVRHFVVALIRRGTEAKVVYYSGKKYETVISTTQFPPIVTTRRAP